MRPRIMEWIWAGIACVLLAAYLSGCQSSVFLAGEPEAVCETDADCMLHCPPPSDDPDCDGGPEQ